METKQFEDMHSRTLKCSATVNLQPDIINVLMIDNKEKEVNEENSCNEVKFSYFNPEASWGGRGGGRSGPQRIRHPGSRSRTRDKRGGARKRHPNFAARNRKIGKGGPTGRGGLSGIKKRRPTKPRPPDNSGSEPEDNYQEVDQRTGRTKRRQRPKSERIVEQIKKRKEEDAFRKSDKKKRAGPKKKDKNTKYMKEKVKRFWRETPKPKDKKAPKFIDGFESDKMEQQKSGPEDFDDLRMPSKEQLKKIEKAKLKLTRQKQKKQERKLLMDKFVKLPLNNKLVEANKRLINGEYIPPFPEIKGMEGSINLLTQDTDNYKYIESQTNPLPQFKLKPKEGSRAKDIDVQSKDGDCLIPNQTTEFDYKTFLEQQNQFGQFNRLSENTKNVFPFKYTESGDESKIIKADKSMEQTEISLNVNDTNIADTNMETKSRASDNNVDDEEYWPKYRKDLALKIHKRSLLGPGMSLSKKQLDELRKEDENILLANNLDFKNERLPHETGKFENDILDYESNIDPLGKDGVMDRSKLLKEFERDYEDIKEYFMKESASRDENEDWIRNSSDNNCSDREYETASDNDEVWNRSQKSFVKQIRKKRVKNVAVKAKEDHRAIKQDKEDVHMNSGVFPSQYYNINEEHLNEISGQKPKVTLKIQNRHNRLTKERGINVNENFESNIQLDNNVLNRKNNLNYTPKEGFEQLSPDVMSDIDVGFDVKDKIISKEGNIDLIRTGTIVDDKLEVVLNSKKNSSHLKHNELLLDDVGQLLYNDDDPMVKLPEYSTEEEWQNEDIERGLDMKEYENYDELVGSKVEKEPGNSYRTSKHKEHFEEVEVEEPENVDLTEGGSSSESYREEYDVAFMAGLRTDRIRVYDRNVKMYADQDHQAKRDTITQTQEVTTLSDFEYERAKYNGDLNENKLCDDDILVLTETDEPKRKGKKSKTETLLESSRKEKLPPKEILNPYLTLSRDYPRLNSLKTSTSEIPVSTMADKDSTEKVLEPDSQALPENLNDHDDADKKKEKAVDEGVEERIEELKKKWDAYVTASKDCFNEDLPDELDSSVESEIEEDEQNWSIKDELELVQSSVAAEKHLNKEEDSSIQTSQSTSTGEILMEQTAEIKERNDQVESAATVPNTSLTEQRLKSKNGINEYTEEDKWDLWYRFIALMNNNNTRTYDNCAALFKAKKQEILTRKKAPQPPWEEPGLDDYERKRRIVQREWEKTERYYALKGSKGFTEFLQEAEGIPEKDVYDKELEESYRSIFDLLNVKNYNHEAYKDSLSVEELAEIYSKDELEEELRARELRKQGKGIHNEIKEAQASGQVTQNPIDEFLFNEPITEFSHYDTVPDWIKNDETNPINYKTYSKKMGTELESTIPLPNDKNPSQESLPASNEIQDSANYHGNGINHENQPNYNVFGVDSTAVSYSSQDIDNSIDRTSVSPDSNESKGELSKGEQAKKMWQYFLQLMKGRHERTIERFLALTPSIKVNSEDEARNLWLQYAAFTSGDPIPTKMPEARPADQVAFGQVSRPPQWGNDTRKMSSETTYVEQPNDNSSSRHSGGVQEKLTDLPSSGWRTLMQRIEALKMEPRSTNYPTDTPQQIPPQQPTPSQGGFGGRPPPPSPYQGNGYHNAPASPWDAYPTYQPQQQYPYGQQDHGYSEAPSQPPFRQPDPYYVPPMYQQQPMTGYEHPVQSPPQPRGLQGMNQYLRFVSQRGDAYDPYNKPLPPNVSINRSYNAPEMGFENPYFTRSLEDRAAYINNQSNPYLANRSRVGWPGDHSDKFHNRKSFISNMGGQQTYIPRDFSGQPGDHSNRYYNRSNFRNPNFNYRDDTYSQPHPFARAAPDPNDRSIRTWQSGTRPLASSGLGSGPTIPTGTANRPENSFVPENQDQVGLNEIRPDSTWPPGTFSAHTENAGSSQPSLHRNPPLESNNVQIEE